MYDFFLCSSLRSLEYRVRNQDIITLIKSYNFTIYAPQDELPVSSMASDEEILLENVTAIKKTKYVLAILHGAGEGVYLELGIAYALGKNIIVYFDKKGTNGRMISGFLKRTQYIIDSLQELHKILTYIKDDQA